MKETLNEKLLNLEVKLNEAHKRFLEIEDIKSQEYKQCREEYLNLANEYSELFRKKIKLESKGESIESNQCNS